MSKCRFYLDENVNPIIADQLKLHGIDVITARDLDSLGDDDPSHLARATRLERILCTHDQDFLKMATQNIEHSGIIFAEQYGATIGGWVRALRKIHAEYTPEDLKSLVTYINAK